MTKRVSFLISLTIVVTLTGTALAQGPIFPDDSDPTWQASYWNNKSLTGTPVLQRGETNLNHDWGSGSPHSSVNADDFSARWTRYIYVTDGTYRFEATSDDGMRVYVDNELIINEWYDHPAKTVRVEKELATGHHWVVVEFYENGGRALAKLSWEPVSTPSPNWQGQYFDNATLSGTPALVRDDAQIDFDWGANSPAPGVIGVDYFSVRWTRTLDLPAGYYRFAMTVDDGGRLWVNDHLLIESWQDQPAQTFTGEIFLPGGDVPIKMEYYEGGGNAVARLSWELLSQPIHNWRGEYFDNMSLSGTPALVRDDAQILFDWQDGSPAPGTIGTDRFSVRWTRTLNLAAGRYRFTMTVDDGARLWVNNQLLIDAWYDQAEQTYTADIELPGGPVPVKMEYYEHAGHAVARLSWSEHWAVYNWRGEYFDNMSLSGTPALVRDDAQILFDWQDGSPAPGTIGTDRFSVRWTRTLNLAAGHYRFAMTVDDGGRLWVNNHLLVDVWYDQARQTYTAEVDLPGGPVPVKMEYYEHAGHAVAQLSWIAGSTPPSPGTVVVDDDDAGFITGGSSTGWRTASEGYGGHLTWTWNNDWQRPNYNWARWYPNLAPGRYEVQAFIPERYTTTSQARYQVSHADGSTLHSVDQSANGGRWVSLGTFYFAGTDDECVLLTDATDEPRLTRLIAFDAIRWVPR